ncbi:MAG: PEP-utilizing enzyme [Bacteriovoracia bacterium]
MSSLWLRFQDDTSLPENVGPVGRRKLAEIFDPRDAGSPWSRACATFGAPTARPSPAGTGPGNSLVNWLAGEPPYVNWSAMIHAASHGSLQVVPDPKLFFTVQSAPGLGKYISLVKLQWRLEKTIEDCLRWTPPTGESSPVASGDGIHQSLLLGLAILSLTLRLPTHTEVELAHWLMEPQQAPLAARRTLELLQKLQMKRTDLSHYWLEIFPDEAGETATPPGPLCYWLDETGTRRFPTEAAGHSEHPMDHSRGTPTSESPPATAWQGSPVCAGQVHGEARFIDPMRHPPSDVEEGAILIFAKARPDSVEYFTKARAVLFCTGGLMSHACTVARERHLPCVTALGREFEALARRREKLTLELDGTRGSVKLV